MRWAHPRRTLYACLDELKREVKGARPSDHNVPFPRAGMIADGAAVPIASRGCGSGYGVQLGSDTVAFGIVLRHERTRRRTDAEDPRRPFLSVMPWELGIGGDGRHVHLHRMAADGTDGIHLRRFVAHRPDPSWIIGQSALAPDPISAQNFVNAHDAHSLYFLNGSLVMAGEGRIRDDQTEVFRTML